ncbi:MAG: universal stress protein [Sedimentibacter sp.]
MHKNVLVCVTQQKTCKRLIEHGIDLAKDEDGNLYVINVVNETDKLLYSLSDGDALEYLFQITKDVGANLIVKRSKDVAKTIIDFAVEKEITHIVLGSSKNNDSASNFAIKLQKKLPNIEFIL